MRTGKRLLVAVAVSATLLAAGSSADACQTVATQAAACAAMLCGDAVAPAVTAVTAVGYDVPAAPPASASAASGGPVAAVTIGDLFFSPAQVTIPTGAQVQWTHEGFLPHTATSSAVPPVFDSGTMVSGGTFSHAFANLGAFDYECLFHFGMEGRVTVRLPGDANGDNAVTIADFSIVGANFNQGGATYDTGDFNLNGTVEIGDFAVLAANFNTSAGATASRGAAVPEPSSAAGVVGIAVLAWRRRGRGRT